MINLKKADLTTTEQKVVAGFLLALALGVLYFVLPPLVVLFKNIVLLCIWGGILVMLCLFWPLLWEYAKMLSWELTKKLISSNPVWHLRRGIDYMNSRMDELSKHINAVSSIKKITTKKVNELIEENNNLALVHQRETNEGNKKIIARKIATNESLINSLTPKIDMAQQQQSEMTKLLDVWRVDTQILSQDIDSLETQYELMKSLSAATSAASAFMQKDTPEMKMFKESMRQTEKAIFDYTSNVESFQREVAPSLALSTGKSQLLESDGLALIEQYKQKRLNKS